MAGACSGRDGYDLEPLFQVRPARFETVRYRQEVFLDLEDESLLRAIHAFAEGMRSMRRGLEASRTLPYKFQKERWYLDAAGAYCAAVEAISDHLARATLRSRGLLAFRAWCHRYVESASFRDLCRETESLTRELSAIRYQVRIDRGAVTVDRCGAEIDFTQEISRIFERFRHAPGKDYRARVPSTGMSHVEARVLRLVARLHPAPFGRLSCFPAEHPTFCDPAIATFDRESQFYLAWIEYTDPLRRAGLPFCYPEVSADSKEISCRGIFDVALARLLVAEGQPVVLNDLDLNDPERICVVTGPNSGGKTTFARALGQLHHLAGLGCTVPGRRARLFFPDAIFSHFEREEDLRTQRGKLEQDLTRLRRILEGASPKSIVILNEVFSSTTARDGSDLAAVLLRRLSDLDALVVCVTFLDELSRLDEKTASFVAGVDPEDPTRRTFRMERKPADGRAYALALAAKHGLSYDQVKERLSERGKTWKCA